MRGSRLEGDREAKCGVYFITPPEGMPPIASGIDL